MFVPWKIPRRPDGGRFSFAHGAGGAQWKRGVSKTAFEPRDADSTRIPYVAVYRWVSLTEGYFFWEVSCSFFWAASL